MADSKEFRDHPSRLAICLGQDVSGVNRYADLTKMPHLLICGATNSGKSIGIASLIMSLLLRNTPKDVRFVMIDPKRVELSLFDNVPHLMCPVVKDVKEAPGVLRAVCREMDRRYDLLTEAGVRNIDSWNERASFQEKMSYIVVVIDELADLMMTAPREVEISLARLAQKARATGIHLIVATQRPSTDVVTGMIKNNFPARISFRLASRHDSQTIINGPGAETLLGDGDMLVMTATQPVTRVQGAFVSEEELHRVVGFLKEQGRPVYDESILKAREGGGNGAFEGDEDDPVYDQALDLVSRMEEVSVSKLQREMRLGYNKAAKIIERMEREGVVGPANGVKPRQVLVRPIGETSPIPNV